MDVNTAWNPVCVPEPTLAPVVTNTCAHKAMCHEYTLNEPSEA